MVKGQNAAALAHRRRRPPPLAAVTCTRYKGVRLRSWGSWVSEIRVPHSREKIWLGSYATAEQAAHAFDAATLLLRGPSCAAFLNFADSTLFTSITQRAAHTSGPVSPHTIRAAAAAVAKAAAESQPSADRVLANEAAVDTSETSTGHCSQLYVSEQEAPPCETEGRGHNFSAFDSMLQDVISLLSPKEKSTNQLHNSVDHFDDFHPFATLARDGFIAISAAATTLERFVDADPKPCEMIDVRLWNYV